MPKQFSQEYSILPEESKSTGMYLPPKKQLCKEITGVGTQHDFRIIQDKWI